MSYHLHYYKELGNGIRLELYANEPAFKPKEIGNVLQGLSLEIQGQQDDIDTPIVKTSLSMSMVNASDLKNRKMNGSWEFFALATEKEWMAKIVRISDSQVLWSGYVTPDSYSEELRYRGSCSIIVRDNIGQLQNYDFDAEGDADGMISFQDLINAAWAKVDNGMSLEILPHSLWFQTAEYTSIPEALMNVSAFENKNWYEVLESVLYSFGAVMRYRGENTFVVCSLRYLPTMGLSSESIIPKMMSGASREFAPACKSIEEEAKYELEESKDVELVTSQDYSGVVVNTEYEGKDVFGATIKGQAPVYALTKTMYELGWSNPISQAPLLLNPSAYTTTPFIKPNLVSDMLFLTNTTGVNEVVYSANIKAAPIKISMSFGDVFAIYGKALMQIRGTLTTITYGISATQLGITKYWDGSSWVTEQTKLDAEFDKNAIEVDCSLSSFSGSVIVRLHIYSIQRTDTISTEEAGYVCLEKMEIKAGGVQSLRSVNRIITRYNDNNNVVLSRSPKFASAFDYVLFPSFIKNGVFQRLEGQIMPTPDWIISYDAENDKEDISQLAACIHMQLIPYYVKPNGVINATILNADLAHYNTRYLWDGRKYMLMSGSFNLITGYLDGAVLREYEMYDKTWYGNGYLLTESGEYVVTSKNDKVIVKN